MDKAGTIKTNSIPLKVITEDATSSEVFLAQNPDLARRRSSAINSGTQNLSDHNYPTINDSARNAQYPTKILVIRPPGVELKKVTAKLDTQEIDHLELTS